MGKVAFIFPGQGTQYIGMAKDFYDNRKEAKDVFDLADSLLDFSVTKTCFEENDLLGQTEYTQPCLVTACLSILEVLKSYNLSPDITAGLSLGEYPALVTAGAMTKKDAIKLVYKRGFYMANEVPSGTGGMAAVIGLTNEKIEQICSNVSEELNSCVEPANYNYSGQVVISGEIKAVERAKEKLLAEGARKVVPLHVSGPFHSSLLVGAGKKLAKELEDVTFNNLTIPYVCNVSAEVISDQKRIKDLLEKQVSSGVKWEQSVKKMINEGVDTFIEIGPGRTLNGFIRKIDRTKKVINIEKLEDLEKLQELL